MEKMNLQVFRERFSEVVRWSECETLSAFCRKYGYSANRLQNLFDNGMKILDFLYAVCKDNEVEASWLLGVTET